MALQDVFSDFMQWDWEDEATTGTVRLAGRSSYSTPNVCVPDSDGYSYPAVWIARSDVPLTLLVELKLD